MKAAFLFSGQLRGFPHCLENYKKNLFSSFDEYDTFFYIPNEDGLTLLNLFTPTSCTIEQDQYHPDIENFENDITYSEDKIKLNRYHLKGKLQHYYLQWYGVKRVFELFENYKNVNNIQYDVVFRTRTDFNFLSPLKYEYFDGLQIPSYNSWGGIYDRFAYGPEKYIKYYCSLYDRIMEGNYKEFKYNGNSESKLRQHLEFNNIPIKLVNLNYQRLNYNGTLQCNLP